ncbi:NUDIX hydrolase [Bifidobacterium callimiconis]|uniref:DNA mismatch repair protein MutT n=1 Tax=Bifidobacterium callimiconis TaxID=2306973 RepID=A0A430FDD0_9BIFI|nr:NUDIX hydrolase [Bifidobacterium callimiconis]RSX50853.1 DNA mismatch repair protein MutT [Bifidobacterium callimiconis]
MNTVVEAAGGIVYRWCDGVELLGDAQNDPDLILENIEVCVIHRPKYNDWSWPKGKLEINESHRHAAVREIGEETGLAVALGAYIGDVEYPLDDEGKRGKRRTDPRKPSKHVCYWIASIIDDETAMKRRYAFGPINADKHEVDNVLWMSPADARHKLTHVLDRDVLDEFVRKVKAGILKSKMFLLIRHGKAEGRKFWGGTDADRPITPLGSAAAYALTREIACFGVNRLVTSPWRRCVGTIQTFAWQTGLPVNMADDLTEDAYASQPDSAWECLRHEMEITLRTGQITAVCMHRPVIGGVFEHMRALCERKSLAKQLPAKTPYMATGHAVAFNIVNTDNGPAIIDIQKVSPIVY